MIDPTENGFSIMYFFFSFYIQGLFLPLCAAGLETAE